jgi:hypothetical protein
MYKDEVHIWRILIILVAGLYILKVAVITPSTVVTHCSRCSRRELARGEESHEEVVQVLYQRLRPVVDHVVRKTRIPEDGHQRWKKYGSKAIRNAYFCR